MEDTKGTTPNLVAPGQEEEPIPNLIPNGST